MLFMTPEQLNALSGLHRDSRETITLQAAYGEPGCVLVTMWLIGGQPTANIITPEGGVKRA